MKGKIISLALLFLFVFSCFCPFYSFNEKSLNGLELYLLQLGEFAFVENVFVYFHFLIQALIPFWFVIIFYCLFIRVILSYYSLISFLIFVVISSFIWYSELEDRTGVSYGYWIWIGNIFGVSIYLILRTHRNNIVKKKNTATD